MATVKEEFELLKAKILAGKSNEIVHVVWHDQERKRRKENPGKSTRIIVNCYSPEGYAELRPEIDRFFEVVRDPHITVTMLARALKNVDDATLRAWLAAGHEPNQSAGPVPEKAALPDSLSWLK